MANESSPQEKPPAFRELGNIASSIFEKEFYSGRYRLSVKTKTCSGIDFHLEGEKNLYSGISTASLQTALDYPELGVTFIKRWMTNSTFFGKILAKSMFLCGFDTSGEMTFNPYTGEKSGVLSLIYQKDYVNALVECHADSRRDRLVQLSAVGRLSNFVAGLQLKYDQPNHRILSSAFAGGYVTPNFALSSMVENGTRYTTSMCQKVGEDVDAGFVVKYDSQQNISYAAFGSSWIHHNGISLRGKMDTMCNVGVSVSRYFRPEMLVTFTVVSNVQNFNSSSSEFGFAIEFHG